MQEQITTNPKEEQLSKMSLDLERVNQMTENTTDKELKEKMIFKADKLNEQVAILEEQSGLSREVIMENYDKLSQSIIDENVKYLIKEFEPKIQEEILKDIANRMTDSLVSYVKELSPQRLVYATSVALLLSISTMAMMPESALANEQYVIEIPQGMDYIDQEVVDKQISALSQRELSDEFLYISEAVFILGEVDKLVEKFNRMDDINQEEKKDILQNLNDRMIRLRVLMEKSHIMYNKSMQNIDFLESDSRTRIIMQYVLAKLLSRTSAFNKLNSRM